MSSSMAFNFTSSPKKDFIHVRFDRFNGAPLYHSAIGYGFVDTTGSLPPREVHTSTIDSNGSGFFISETSFQVEAGSELHYNHFGMCFRVNAPPGVYEICVKTTSEIEDTMISISGIQAERILEAGFWDAAQKVPKRSVASASGKEWSFTYANGRQFIDIEIEPRMLNTPVGIEEIVIRPTAVRTRSKDQLPTMFLLGDSTVKSYTFEEAPMSGWGQVIGKLFDERQVNVINYSMGGRSYRNAYAEGRFNDIVTTGCAGDYIFIQFGHNDERVDEHERFGRGSTEEMYEAFIQELYIPAIRARGLQPILVTPVSRINAYAEPGYIYTNSFKRRRFPDIVKRLGQELDIPVIDLNSKSVEYYNEIGVEATTACFMSIEAGETPGKTNDGSYANGHPSNKIDGTHYKEALSKQLARIVVSELARLGAEGVPAAVEITSYLKESVKLAIASGDWSQVHPEVTRDTTIGIHAYYRNQIEKLLQLGAMSVDSHGYFHPHQSMRVHEFIAALGQVLHVNPDGFTGYGEGELSRELMAAIVYDAYQLRFSSKPRYMTDYNGRRLTPSDPGYDPNLDSGATGIMYNPIVPFNLLTDVHLLSQELAPKVKAAYELGLIRADKGILRGKNMNGTELEPKSIVTRAKAAKVLYFMWVLGRPIREENQFV
jgi:lysophospholipase L1-like esterase